MAIQKGSRKRVDRKQAPPDSLGPRPDDDEEDTSRTSQNKAALLALAARQSSAATSTKKKHKRGQAGQALVRAKAERAMENADRLHAKAGKRAKRDEKRRRAKESVR